jgi:hypothetical protein
LTGATQLFNFHEAHGNYHPPASVEKLSSVHKDQVYALGHHDAPPEPEGGAQEPGGGTTHRAGVEDDGDMPQLSTLALKIFFLLVGPVTALGLWMGLTQTRQKRLAWMLALPGALNRTDRECPQYRLFSFSIRGFPG